MTGELSCTLCGYRSRRWSEYSEGAFCEDAAGCRRRALANIQALEETVVELHSRLSFFENVEHPGTEPDAPAEQP